MTYLVGWLMAWTFLSFGIHKFLANKKKKSTVMTIGGGFIGAVILLIIGAYIEDRTIFISPPEHSVAINSPQNTRSIANPPTNPCEPIKDPKACHAYAIKKMNEVGAQIKSSQNNGQNGAGLQDKLAGWIQKLKQNCDAGSLDSCMTCWILSNFKMTEFLEKSNAICVKLRTEESCGSNYDLLANFVKDDPNSEFSIALVGMIELSIKPYIARIRFAKSESTPSVTLDELLNKKELYLKKVISIEGYGAITDAKEGVGSIGNQEKDSASSKLLLIYGLQYFPHEKENTINKICPNVTKGNYRPCGKVKIWGELFGSGDTVGFDVWHIEQIQTPITESPTQVNVMK